METEREWARARCWRAFLRLYTKILGFAECLAGDAVLIAPVSKQIPWYQGILQGILRFWGLETRFSTKKPLRCSHFSSNSLRKLTAKIFWGTANLFQVSANFYVILTGLGSRRNARTDDISAFWRAPRRLGLKGELNLSGRLVNLPPSGFYRYLRAIKWSTDSKPGPRAITTRKQVAHTPWVGQAPG